MVANWFRDASPFYHLIDVSLKILLSVPNVLAAIVGIIDFIAT